MCNLTCNGHEIGYARVCNLTYLYVLLEVCIYPMHHTNSRIMGVYWMDLIMTSFPCYSRFQISR